MVGVYGFISCIPFFVANERTKKRMKHSIMSLSSFYFLIEVLSNYSAAFSSTLGASASSALGAST